MHADAHVLLSSVLDAVPCVDASLQSTVQTTPLVVHALVQQCYYVLHLVSSARALLFDDRSAYTTVVQRMAQQRVRLEQLRLHHGGDSNNSDKTHNNNKATAHGAGGNTKGDDDVVPAHARIDLRAPLPAVHTCNSLDVKVVLVGGGGTVGRRLLHVLLRSSAATQQQQQQQQQQQAACGVAAAGGGGSSSTSTLVHSTRITVITRQPEKLNAVASRGVVCVDSKHGRSALASCDVLVLACQPEQLSEFVAEYFATSAYTDDDGGGGSSSNDNKMDKATMAASNAHSAAAAATATSECIARKAVTLKRTAVIFSCLSTLPPRKLARLMRHDVQLIVQASVRTIPRARRTHSSSNRAHTATATSTTTATTTTPPLPAQDDAPAVAARYAAVAQACAQRRVRHMADHDSFLRSAVAEAERLRIEEHAQAMLAGGSAAHATATSAAAAAAAVSQRQTQHVDGDSDGAQHDEQAADAAGGGAACASGEDADDDNDNNTTAATATMDRATAATATTAKGTTRTGAVVPYVIAHRAARAAAMQAAQAQYLPPPLGRIVCDELTPPHAFLCAVWRMVQHYTAVASGLVAPATSSSSSSTATTAAAAGGGGAHTEHDKKSKDGKGGAARRSVRSSNGKSVQRVCAAGAGIANKQSSCTSSSNGRDGDDDADKEDGPLLCTALALLPASLHTAVAAVVVHRYAVRVLCALDHRPPPPPPSPSSSSRDGASEKDDEDDEDDEDDTVASARSRIGADTAEVQLQHQLQPHTTSPAALRQARTRAWSRALQRRLPDVFAPHTALWQALRARYVDVVRAPCAT